MQCQFSVKGIRQSLIQKIELSHIPDRQSRVHGGGKKATVVQPPYPLRFLPHDK